MIREILCEYALVGVSWEKQVLLRLDSDGTIAEILPNFQNDSQVDSATNRREANSLTKIDGFVVPGMANVHSHAFQRAFAGLSEFQTPRVDTHEGGDGNADSFWTWRDLMYRFLTQMTVEDIYAVASQLFTEMLVAGYTTVGEFQYIHNDLDGTPYQKTQQVSDAVVRAATDVGMPICILPVLYQRGGFDSRELSGGQKRFQLDDQTFIELLSQLHQQWNGNRLVSFGAAFHSLRAVDPLKYNGLVQQVFGVFGECPIHIHVAEQIPEVTDCIQATGKRPVEWLMDSADVDENWCLIHATHLTEHEIESIAKSGSTVGLCPTTEANLGDGIFAGNQFKSAGGKISIGSDSHISIDVFSELRMLEYGQRLKHHSRAVMCTPTQSCGDWLYTQCAIHGSNVVDRNSGEIAVGKVADLIVLDPKHPSGFEIDTRRVLDKAVFFEYDTKVRDVMIAGGFVIRNRKHVDAESTRAAFVAAMNRLS